MDWSLVKNKKIVHEHFYTQDFFVLNAFDPTEQVLLIYYKATITEKALDKLKVLDADINELLWLSKEELNVEKFTLDADKVVVDLYKKENFES